MKIYTLYIEDDRYSVPTLLTAEMPDDDRVMHYTADILSQSQHYLAVEVWDGDRRVGATMRDDGAEQSAQG
jgi:hypothetical protein